MPSRRTASCPRAPTGCPARSCERPELGIHTVDEGRGPGDIGQFLLDVDPCPSTRPNWIPAGEHRRRSTTPPRPPLAHEAVVQSLLAPRPALYPGGAMRSPRPPTPPRRRVPVPGRLVPAAGERGQGAHRLPQQSPEHRLRARRLGPCGRAVLVGPVTGYAGRPVLDVEYEFAWSDETGLSGEALVLARKARRFYYPSAYPTRAYANYPDMDDPMQPGPALASGSAATAPPSIPGCDRHHLAAGPRRRRRLLHAKWSGRRMSRYPSSTVGRELRDLLRQEHHPGARVPGPGVLHDLHRRPA